MTFIISCDKDELSPPEAFDDFNIENFLDDAYFSTYNSHYNPLPLLESRSSEIMTKAVKDYFAQNSKEAKQVEARYGMPIWSSAFNMDGELGHFIKIPLAKKNSKHVDAVLFGSLNSSNNLNVKVYTKNKIKDLKKKKEVKKDRNYFLEISQDYFAGALMYFDHITFQTTDCSLTDYFEKENGVIENNDKLEERSCVTYIIETTWYQIVYSSSGTVLGTSVLSSTYDYVRICNEYGSTGGWNGDYYGEGWYTGGTTNGFNENELGGHEVNLIIDPDLWPDCESFEFKVADNGIYQTCGVLGLEVDVSRQYIDYQGNPRAWHVGWSYGQLYFEFPHIRRSGSIISPGEAASTVARIVRKAELLMEDDFKSYQSKPSGNEVSKSFTYHLKELLRQQGGRVSNIPYYGYAPINVMSYKRLGYGYCP